VPEEVEAEEREESKSEFVTLRLSKRTLEKLDRIARELGTTRSELVRFAVFLLLLLFESKEKSS